MNPRVKHVSARVRPKRRKSNKLEKSEKIAFLENQNFGHFEISIFFSRKFRNFKKIQNFDFQNFRNFDFSKFSKFRFFFVAKLVKKTSLGQVFDHWRNFLKIDLKKNHDF